MYNFIGTKFGADSGLDLFIEKGQIRGNMFLVEPRSRRGGSFEKIKGTDEGSDVRDGVGILLV